MVGGTKRAGVAGTGRPGAREEQAMCAGREVVAGSSWPELRKIGRNGENTLDLEEGSAQNSAVEEAVAAQSVVRLDGACGSGSSR